MADARLQRTRDHYPEGCPQFGAAARYERAMEAWKQRYMVPDCVALGHVYGEAGRCLFCQQPKPLAIQCRDGDRPHYYLWSAREERVSCVRCGAPAERDDLADTGGSCQDDD